MATITAAAMPGRRPPGSSSGGFVAIRSVTAVPLSTSFSITAEADLSCLEDEAWEKDVCDNNGSTGTAAGPCMRRVQGGGRMVPLRRARPRATQGQEQGLGFSSGEEGMVPREEKVDVLVKMLKGQGKFQPRIGRGARARCHEVSPFVAERRRWFVAWKNQMASFLGYSRDTVAVALNYFDRYTCATTCSPTLAQAVAATALHVAAKFEESNPASLRELLKFTPVFTPDQLLVMEMSMLKVLNWDLRPVTIFDFVRGFCNLLPVEGVAVVSREDGRDGSCMEELRVGAEEIADLSACEVNVLECMPSTLALSAILLSASRPEALTSHEEILETLATAPGVSELVPLEDVLKCIRLLGASLAKRYPAAGAAADIAAEHVAAYAGLEDEVEADVARDLAAVETTGSSGSISVGFSNTATPLPQPKKRRCSTPTGVDGIMHIEMASIRDHREPGAAATAVAGSDPSNNRCAGSNPSLCSSSSDDASAANVSSIAAADAASSGGTGLSRASNLSSKNDQSSSTSSCSLQADAMTDDAEKPDAKRPRPTTKPQTDRPSRSARAFSFSDDDVASADENCTTDACSTAADSPPAFDSEGPLPAQSSSCVGAKSCTSASWQNSLAHSCFIVAGGSSTSSDAGERKRAAEALGHCERESSFGAPVRKAPSA